MHVFILWLCCMGKALLCALQGWCMKKRFMKQSVTKSVWKVFMHYVCFCAQLFMVGLLCCTLPILYANTHTHTHTHTHTAVLCKKLSSGFLILMLMLVSQCVCGFLSDSFYSFPPAHSKYTDSIMHMKNKDRSKTTLITRSHQETITIMRNI